MRQILIKFQEFCAAFKRTKALIYLKRNFNYLPLYQTCAYLSSAFLFNQSLIFAPYNTMMRIYRSKYGKLPGTTYSELMRAARKEYRLIEAKNPRRQAYIRSAYFKKDKVFINQFWEHLKQKWSPDKVRRLQLYTCALDLIINSHEEPITKQNPQLHWSIGTPLCRHYKR